MEFYMFNSCYLNKEEAEDEGASHLIGSATTVNEEYKLVEVAKNTIKAIGMTGDYQLESIESGKTLNRIKL